MAFLCVAAIGNRVFEYSRWPDLARLSGRPWGVHHVVAASSATGFVGETIAGYSSGDESTLRCFPWNSSVKVICEAEASVYVVMDDDVTVRTSTAHGHISDPGTPANGIGNVDWVEPNQATEMWIYWSLWPSGTVSATSKPGYRSSACSSPAALVGYPCDATDDCPGGACSASVQPTCAFVAIVGPAATTCKIGEGL